MIEIEEECEIWRNQWLKFVAKAPKVDGLG